MALDFGTLVREVGDLWQSPAMTELPLEVLLGICNRSVRQVLIDLDLTPEAAFLAVRSAQFSITNPDTREKDLSFLDSLSRPERLESRSNISTSDDDWTEVVITSFENWNDIMERADNDYAAFYGTPPALRMIVNRDFSNEVFRLVYTAQAVDVTGTTDSVALPDSYKPFLVYDIALECGEAIDNLSPEFQAKKRTKMPYLAQKRAEAKAQMDRWRRSQRGSSVSQRRSFSDRNTGLNFGRRRFQIQF